jgi:hypothetical protein
MVSGRMIAAVVQTYSRDELSLLVSYILQGSLMNVRSKHSLRSQ